MPTITHAPGKFVWRELLTRDVEAAKRFYGELLGWTFEDRPMGPGFTYTLLKLGSEPIGGLMDLASMPDGKGEHIPPNWSVSVSAPDVDATAKRAVEEGGKLLDDCMDIEGVGRFAVLQDPQGAVITLIRFDDGDGEEAMPKPHEFCWESLQTPDPAAASAYYQKVLGWGVTQEEAGIPIFTRQGPGGEVYLANIVPATEMPPHWATYVAVEDLETANAKVQALGGTVILQRFEVPVYGAFSVIQDPTGAFVNLFQPNRG